MYYGRVGFGCIKGGEGSDVLWEGGFGCIMGGFGCIKGGEGSDVLREGRVRMY